MVEVNYKLKSIPERSVSIPEQYAVAAQSLVDRIFEAVPIPDDFDLTCLRNPGISARARALLIDKTSLRLQDALYLRVCIYRNEQEIEKDRNNQSLFSLEDVLTELLKSVERVK